MDLLPAYPGLRKVKIFQVWNLHLKPFMHFCPHLGSLVHLERATLDTNTKTPVQDRTKAVGWVEFLSLPPFPQFSKYHLEWRGDSDHVPRIYLFLTLFLFHLMDFFFFGVCNTAQERDTPHPPSHSLSGFTAAMSSFINVSLFHSPKFRGPILETSGCPELMFLFYTVFKKKTKTKTLISITYVLPN